MDLRIISIGALAAHPLRDEKEPRRAPHGTTSLIRAGDAVILVDPGLPEEVLAARLSERAGIAPADVTHVFLTCFKPDLRRGLLAFEHAAWWISSAEREGFGVPLIERLERAAEEGEEELRASLELDVAILKRCEPAPDSLAGGVDLFPLPGVTPGLTGLLLAMPRHTTLICGDAVATIEHLERGQVLQSSADVARAQESFREAVEIADVLVPGRDNITLNPLRSPF